MTEREKLLKKISATQFAAWELNIFLDTHPNNSEALASFKRYKKQAEELKREYAMNYGPLTAGDVYGDTRFTWVNDPWPWDVERECD